MVEFGKGLTILLPGRLNDAFAETFRFLGFDVLWHENEAFLESVIKTNDFDLAFEWQYGSQDHTVLSLVKKYKPHVPVVLCMNWKENFTIEDALAGYFGKIDPPFKVDELREIVDCVHLLKEKRP